MISVKFIHSYLNRRSVCILKKLTISALLSGVIVASSLPGSFASAAVPAPVAVENAETSMGINFSSVIGSNLQDVGQGEHRLWNLLNDPVTGLRFFRWQADADSYQHTKYVVKDKAGQWFRLNGNIQAPYHTGYDWGDGVREPEYRVQLQDKQDWLAPLAGPTYYYHLQDQVIFRGLSYYWSPDRSYGYTLVMAPQNGSWYGFSLLAKESATGQIRELLQSDTRLDRMYWLNNNELLLCKFDHETQQNELLLANAADGTMKHFAYGSLKGFDPDKKEVLFVYNEPTRTPHILNAATGKIRKAAAIEPRFEMKQQSYGQEILTTLEPETLEEWNPPVITRYEHKLLSGDKSIPLLFTVNSGGTLYIPIKTLLDGLELKLGEKQGTAANYRYPLQTADGQTRTELGPDNSIVLGGQLFTTRGVLQSLGYADVIIQAVTQEDHDAAIQTALEDRRPVVLNEAIADQ